MPSLQIRDVPEEVYEALSLRARTEHRSLAQQAIVELRRIPELTAREQRLKQLSRIKERLLNAPARELPFFPENLIREDRER